MMPKEWRDIADSANREFPLIQTRVINGIVERCFALANKPVRELTEREIERAYNLGANLTDETPFISGLRAVIAAHQRKQQEPETVTFRAARNRNDHSEIYMAKADSDWSGSNWEWLPGEPQTIEVRLP